jgi:hypothetical protein
MGKLSITHSFANDANEWGTRHPADWADNDMTAFAGVVGMAAGYLRDAKVPAVGGLLLFGRVTVGTALIARSTCVPIAWGPEYF